MTGSSAQSIRMTDPIIHSLLQREIIKWIHKYTVSKATVVGFFAKSPSSRVKCLPDWMHRPVFPTLDGLGHLSTWVDLGVYARKYYVRKNLTDMVGRGIITSETYTAGDGRKGMRMKVVTVLDVLASIDPEDG